MKKLQLFPLVAAALPGWLYAQECDPNINAVTPLPRFTLHDDGTVTDTRTGLRWQRCSVGYELDTNGTATVLTDDHCQTTSTTQFNWQGALQAAESLNTNGGFAGFTDWRVPSIKEIASIVEYKCSSPAINLTVFPNTAPKNYWTSTTYNIIGQAAVLNFQDGINSTAFSDHPNFESFVRLVRGTE